MYFAVQQDRVGGQSISHGCGHISHCHGNYAAGLYVISNVNGLLTFDRNYSLRVQNQLHARFANCSIGNCQIK